MSPGQSAKMWLIDHVGLEKDALHVYVGLTVFLLVALLARLQLRDFRPVAAVVLVAVIGEVVDLTDTSVAGQPLLWRESWHDLWNTCVWPAVIFVLARAGALRV